MINIRKNTKNDIEQICKEAGITYLAVFGSQARGDQKKNSDVDLLVEFGVTPSLISFIHTKQKFEDVFNRKVDLVTKNALSKHLKPYVTQDLQMIYG